MVEAVSSTPPPFWTPLGPAVRRMKLEVCVPLPWKRMRTSSERAFVLIRLSPKMVNPMSLPLAVSVNFKVPPLTSVVSPGFPTHPSALPLVLKFHTWPAATSNESLRAAVTFGKENWPKAVVETEPAERPLRKSSTEDEGGPPPPVTVTAPPTPMSSRTRLCAFSGAIKESAARQVQAMDGRIMSLLLELKFVRWSQCGSGHNTSNGMGQSPWNSTMRSLRSLSSVFIGFE